VDGLPRRGRGGRVRDTAAAAGGAVAVNVACYLTRLSGAPSQKDQFERQQQEIGAQQEWQRRQTELTDKRACYVTTNAAYRRYRIELMNFLYCIKRGELNEIARGDLENARNGQDTTFAEAQMTASSAVLRELGALDRELSQAYRKIKNLEEGAPQPGGSFEEIHAELIELWDHWKQLRTEMRRDLRLDIAEPPGRNNP
jgi:hypothetical protein